MSENATDLVKALYERWGAAFAQRPDMPLDEWREMIEEWPVVAAEPGGVDYTEVDADGVPAMWITPKTSATDRVILGFHGGGFVTGSMYTHRKLFAHLAKAVDSRALLIHYRRAPEHTHPAPVEDGLTAYRWLLAQDIDASRIAFAGDSAGGGMVVTTMLLARDRDVPLPAAGMPLSPWFDLEATGASYELNADKDALLSKEFGLTLARMFLGETGDPRDPLASAVHGQLAGLPAIYIQASSDEVLADDSRSFAALAEQAGVDVRLDLVPGQQHTFQMAVGRNSVADDAIQRLASWVRPHLGL